MVARSVVIIIFSLFFIVEMTFAHGGRTDSEGGHWDHQKKEYHYHRDGKTTVDRSRSSRYAELTSQHDNLDNKKNLKDKDETDKDKKVKLKKDKQDKEVKKDKKHKNVKKDKKEKKVDKSLKKKKDSE